MQQDFRSGANLELIGNTRLTSVFVLIGAGDAVSLNLVDLDRVAQLASTLHTAESSPVSSCGGGTWSALFMHLRWMRIRLIQM